jgi:hypothetical protein
MASTGVYWWPVYHALAQAGIEVCVCNAAHMHNVPGRKRDVTDCQWIAELHEYGLLRPSFIPTGAVAELRAQTRYRKKLIEQRTSERQRLAKVLEARIEIDSVASDLLGKSGRAMIDTLIADERDPARLADLALRRLRRKTEELQMASDGRFTAAHAQMCRPHLDAYDHLTAKIAELDALVAEAAAPFAALIVRLVTIPGCRGCPPRWRSLRRSRSETLPLFLPPGLAALPGPGRVLRRRRTRGRAVRPEPEFQLGDLQLQPTVLLLHHLELRPECGGLSVFGLDHSPQPGKQLTL